MKTSELIIMYLVVCIPLPTLAFAAYLKFIRPYFEKERQNLTEYYREISNYFEDLERQQEAVMLSQNKTVINFYKIKEEQATIANTSQLLNQTFDDLKDVLANPTIKN